MAKAGRGLRRGPDNALRRSPRWTGARRETYFAVLAETGNARAAAEAIGKGHWTSAVERRFLALLRENGNMSASARSVGFTPETVWERRRKFPAFAAAIEAVLDEAELALELRLAAQGNDVVPSAETGTAAADCPPPPFDQEFALKFLKWREEKRRGGGRRGRPPIRPERPIAEVRASILRKIEAIEAHEKRKRE